MSANVKPLQDTDAEMGKLKNFVSRPDPMKTKPCRSATPPMTTWPSRSTAPSPTPRRSTSRSRCAEGGEGIDDAAAATPRGRRPRSTIWSASGAYSSRARPHLSHALRGRADERGPRPREDRQRLHRPTARRADEPGRAAHLPFALAGILIGLVGASGVLLYLLVFRETLITVESVERILGLPVLASVAKRRR